MSAEVVTIEYEDLRADVDLSRQLFEAWGEAGIGILAIRGVPGWMELYPAALRLARPLAHLPAESLRKLEHEASLFNVGWSHGREKLGDKPDFNKASFYFNPLADEPGTEEDRTQFPWALPCNLWPEGDLPALEGACKRLGKVMHATVGHLARLVDRAMAERVENYAARLGTVVHETEKCKGRLLFYYPPKEAPSASAGAEDAVREDGWIGWHSDTGFFTALTPDLYVDDDTGEIIDNPDPEAAGLWVVARGGALQCVPLPRDCLCVQVGECTQVVTGGELVATPHCVRGCRPSRTRGRRVARVSCPCFVDAHPTFQLRAPAGVRREAVLSRGLSAKVPRLADRWEHDGQTFGDFLGVSFRKYYGWNATRDAEAPAGGATGRAATPGEAAAAREAALAA